MKNYLEYFSECTAVRVGNYVYRLVDPRTAETFYVGKGKGNRVFDHVRCALKYEEHQDDLTEKIARINEIHQSGLSVHYIIHRHGISDAAVLEVEAALIDAFPGLTNVQSGYGSSDRGPMTIKEISDKYDLPMIEEPPVEKLLLININRVSNIHDREAVFRQTQLAWKISDKAAGAKYILAVFRGVVVGAFVAESWLPATHDNFQHLIPVGSDFHGRKGFHGSFAPESVWDKFVGSAGKRLVIDGMKHVQNPIRYWNF